MTASSTSRTSINTMLNSGNRWKDSQVSEQPSLGDLLLKTPQRRPSFYFEENDSDSLTMCTSPNGDSTTTIESENDFNESLQNAFSVDTSRSDELPSRRAHHDRYSLQSHRSDSYLVLPQLDLPENKHLRRNIRFSCSVEERQYAITVGDNPSCSGPCPLSLDWEHTDSRTVAYNDDSLSKPRSVRQLSTSERRRRLLQASLQTQGEVRLLELQTVSKKVESLQRELSDLSLDSKRRTKWPKQPKVNNS